MKTITFIRHGQSIANAGGITMEHGCIPLSDLGHAQSVELAASLKLKPSKILVSSYLRAQQTAQPFCEKVSLTPCVHPELHEFSTIDPALLEGLNGEQRRPFVEAYWEEASPTKRLGKNAETFQEFEQRVSAVHAELDQMIDGTVIFGHGMWLALLMWKLIGFSATDSLSMKSFRRFQIGLPMPNCAVYTLQQSGDTRWHIQANETVMRRILRVV